MVTLTPKPPVTMFFMLIYFIAVNALIDHPDVKAVTFAGTSKIAEIIAQRCHRLNKRVLALGGAKVLVFCTG